MRYYKAVFRLFVIFSILIGTGMHTVAKYAQSDNKFIIYILITVFALLAAAYIIYRIKVFRCFNMPIYKLVIELILFMTSNVALLIYGNNTNWFFLIPISVLALIPTCADNDNIDKCYQKGK